MAITRVVLENFTVFDKLDLEPSPGINVLVGANGTGKTHLMKVCYAACDVSKTEELFARKLVKVFLPSGNRPGRLINRRGTNDDASIEIFRGDLYMSVSFPSDSPDLPVQFETGDTYWPSLPIDGVYIPVKEMLSNAPGFRSLYAAREIHFEEVYADILDRAYLPPLRGSMLGHRKRLLDTLEDVMGGKVTVRNEEFFLSGKQSEIEFTLLAEGLRKLGLLWLLIQNGSLKEGAALFWDEPETNLNPKLYGVVIDVLLELQRVGVQVFLATHDYVILKELDLRATEGDKVAFHSLYRSEETGEIACQTSGDYSAIHPNASPIPLRASMTGTSSALWKESAMTVLVEERPSDYH